MTYDYTITLGATAVQLSASVPVTTSTTTARWVSLQADPGNAGVIYVGGNNHGVAVASTSFGMSIPIPASTVPAAPLILDFSPAQSVDLSQFWVKGTTNDVLHVFVIL